MAQLTARFMVVSKEPKGSGGGAQTAIQLRAKKNSDGGSNAENASLFRDDSASKQTMQLELPRSVEQSIFQAGKDVLVTFNGPA